MKISITNIFEKAILSLRRFPVCIAFLAVLTMQLVWRVIRHISPDAWTFFLSVGMLMALLVHLFTENGNKTWKTVALWITSFLLLALDSYFLHTEELTRAVGIAQTAAILALLLAVCFLPFRKEHDDRMSWNFVQQLIGALCLGMVIGFVMFAGLGMLYYGTTVLFTLEVEMKVIEVLAVLCLITLPALIFFLRIPDGQEMYCTSTPQGSFLVGVIRYLFMPLALAYMAVLYVYGFQIIASWSLPKGMLSTLVSILMFGMIAITFLLYPYLRDEKHSGYEIKLIHLLPLLVLPLLVLMSVGIARRFMDYGITANRLYLLTLNIWFYIVAAGLLICHARRINWISILFAALLVVTSCHPWNYTNIYRDVLVDRAHTVIRKYNLNLRGIKSNELREKMSHMTEADARTLYASIIDIHDFDSDIYEKELGADHSCLYSSYESIMGLEKDTVIIHTHSNARNSYSMTYKYDKDDYAIPAGYTHMKSIYTTFQNLHTDATLQKDDYAEYGINCNDSTFIYCSSLFGNITIPHRGLRDSNPVIISIPQHNAKLLIKELTIQDEESNHTSMRFCLEGFIFYNK